jgi:hypothetical protein
VESTQPDVVGPQPGVGGDRPDGVTQQPSRPAQALVVASLAGQVGEQVAQVAVGVAEPAGLGGEAEQGLQDGQGDQFGVAELGRDADRGPPWRQLRCLLQ